MTTEARSVRPFHLAMPCVDVVATTKFYHEVLGCTLGRSAPTWQDFDFFGHQLVFHQAPAGFELGQVRNSVDAHDVPIPHFGVVLTPEDWEKLSQRLTEHQVKFEIAPQIRFKGLPGEQGIFFFFDPNGIALEFKCFKSDDSLFAPQ
jgi:uncharacterized protein